MARKRPVQGAYEPEKCWVGDEHKVCYPDKESAEMSARLIEAEHGIAANSLYAYRCEYAAHWHLASRQKSN